MFQAPDVLEYSGFRSEIECFFLNHTEAIKSLWWGGRVLWKGIWGERQGFRAPCLALTGRATHIRGQPSPSLPRRCIPLVRPELAAPGGMFYLLFELISAESWPIKTKFFGLFRHQNLLVCRCPKSHKTVTTTASDGEAGTAAKVNSCHIYRRREPTNSPSWRRKGDGCINRLLIPTATASSISAGQD